MAARFNVKVAVFDAEPETRKVREFKKEAKFPVFMCDYQERLKVSSRIDAASGVISVRRTEMCDASHNLVTGGLLIIPRKSPEVEEFAKEMSNIAKVLEENIATGDKRFTYRKLGADHYRHATNYFMLACNNPGLGKSVDPNVLALELARKVVQEQPYNPFDSLKRRP